MRLKKKFFAAFICILALVNIAFAAKLTKEQNIANLFTEKNPGLSAKTAKSYASLVLEASKKYKQDPYVIAAIIVHESTVNKNAVSKGGDYGLMQIRWKVHSKALQSEYKIKSSKGLIDPRINIFFGTRIFSECMAKSKDTAGGLLRYSAGSEKLKNKVLATVKELKAREK